ncbi:MAG: alpha/beta hydrolase [Actinomycetota bacterium]|nr:alpha/beta hydrolase [Actinomycetota bacterium]
MDDIRHVHVEANGVRFHVAVNDGDGPDVLCLHGYPEGWQSWRAVMRALPDARVYAPDLRGYGASGRPAGGYDVWTLTEDVEALIGALGLERPVLVGHDWGGELGWLFAHRFSGAISHLVVVNGTHPRTLVRASVRFEHLQGLRLPWIPLFEIPWLAERLLTTRVGRLLLTWAIVVREGSAGDMDRPLVAELVGRFRRPDDMHGPVAYYREFVCTLLSRAGRARLRALYAMPISVPVTQVWGMDDGALIAAVARTSGADAGRELEWRPLEGIGHFVCLEAPGLLAAEIRRVLAP